MFIKIRARRMEASYPITTAANSNQKSSYRSCASHFLSRRDKKTEGRKRNPIQQPAYQTLPYIDGDGVLRVTGRLNNSPIPSNIKHPIVLPKSHPLTMLIIEDCHQRHFMVDQPSCSPPSGRSGSSEHEIASASSPGNVYVAEKLKLKQCRS
ncbi:hypothetical protein Ocin01_19122 [Orchesella cincta]|uniref:Uncharacterized protein n=1 Tax=Orchesella cincta TaxID=48709 RepID=A0A1D2M3L9_ORCCI|nr:hypothetical protein Ocin01_19122 [Orchesella cincta]